VATNNLRENSEYIVLGAQIVASMIGPILLGFFVIDPYFGTEPWGFVGGAVFGFVSVFYNLYKITVMASRKAEDQKKKNSSEQKNDH
jgi:F0F1-type ATP synthase assembly protein I